MLSGSCKFCNNHFPVQLPIFKNILDVSGNGGLITLKQFCQLVKVKPYGITLQPYFYA